MVNILTEYNCSFQAHIITKTQEHAVNDVYV